MNFKIVHETTYLFDNDVFLEPHTLRFRPKSTPYLDLTSFSIKLESPPEGHSVIEDEEHNVIDFCWFDQLTNSLSITAQSTLHTSAHNPFNFIIHPASFGTVPFVYSDHQYQVLYASLQKSALSQDLINYANAVLHASQFKTVNFISKLTAQIHQDFTVEYREVGAPLAADDTFRRKTGSCRDLSWMLISLLRQQGIAARFVSGYFYFEMENPTYELHAWVEAFIPGVGWLGVDPSHGILTGNTHFPVASSAIPENTMPVTGGIRGSASSKMSITLLIEKL